jgi:cytochrome c biogenesis protein CcmG, thiol:disulfide interchange protein DsbE
MLSLARLAPILVFVPITIALGVSLTNDPRRMPSTLIDKPVPNFSLPALSGARAGTPGLTNTDLTGEIRLVNIFASWCAGCKVEHPTLLRLQKENKIPLYGINWKDKPGAGLKWLAANVSPYGKVGEDASGRLGIDLGVTGVPETFVVDGTGRIRYRHAGPITDEVWADVFTPLLASLRKGL